ncbi:MAG TPA: inositol monophosphatase [Candidatus Nanoarchaeia archaeon]|nr:inositol monophosphatase [Candidatus Nanoarchaeia archaeon]
MSLSKEKKVLLQAANSAGKVMLKYFGRNQDVEKKFNKSLVSKADLEANKVIIQTIKKNFPAHNIFSEETGFEDNDSDYKWVIDPIDGTHNFLRGIPIFGVSIALEHRDEVVLGVLHFPVLKLTASAEKGKGAFLNGKRLKVSSNSDLSYSFILYEFVSATRHKSIEFLKRIAHETLDIRNFGSAIYELILVASGQCDAYVIFSTNEWDIAAGMLLIQEAGGKITDLKGNDCNPSEGSFIMSNGKIHGSLLRYLHGI